MAGRKQNSQAAKINLDKALARYTRANAAMREDPDDDRRLAAYRQAKTDVAEARIVWRHYRVSQGPEEEGDAIAEVTSIGVKAPLPKTG